MKVHELKTWPALYERVAEGKKRWELRRNDRGFEMGDLLWLREFDPGTGEEGDAGSYTGKDLLARVDFVAGNFDVPEGLPSGFVIMDIQLVRLEVFTPTQQI